MSTPEADAPTDDRSAAPVPTGRRNGSMIDRTDREVLRILRVNGRTSNVEIARRLGITETTVRKRIAALLADDLVEIVAVPTPQFAGLNVTAIISISVQLMHLQDTVNTLVERPEVRYCGVSTGRYDVMIEAFFRSNEHVMDFVTEVLGPMPGVTDVETSLILKIEKFSYEWQFD